MSILVVGSIAIDSVRTPAGEARDVVGGSAIYFSMAASFFTRVILLGTVGDDFPRDYLEMLRRRNVDVSGVTTARGKTFRWSGDYTEDINRAKTTSVAENVMKDYSPRLHPPAHESPYVFLANIEPGIQCTVLDTKETPGEFVVCDTMNLWIENRRDALREVMQKAHLIMINDGEARLLTGKENLLDAAEELRSRGPASVVIKKGEHGAILATADNLFMIPAYPAPTVVDPTGAGDSFGGAFMGYIASREDTSEKTMRKAVVYGSVVASFAIESFSTRRLEELAREDIEKRVREMRGLVRF